MRSVPVPVPVPVPMPMPMPMQGLTQMPQRRLRRPQVNQSTPLSCGTRPARRTGLTRRSRLRVQS